MQIEDLQVYQIAMDIGKRIWQIVAPWPYFEKETLAKQLVKAADSIAANISEGFGRYHYKESKQFSYYARGSLYETKTWLAKAFERNLLEEREYKTLQSDLDTLGIKLNNYIKSIGKTQ